MHLIAFAPSHPARRKAAFSLVEMIGVLAIIAILAVVIVPKVFSTIASSRITSAVASVTALKSAISDFSGRYGTLPTANNNQRIDDLLVTAGMLESRFTAKIGNPASGETAATWAFANGTWTATGGNNQADNPVQSRVICQNSNQTAPNTANGANFCLNPSTPVGTPPNLTTDSLPLGSRVVSAVLANVTANEAWELSRRLDGDTLSEADATTTADARGKVVYPIGGGTKNVYIYLAHQ